MLASGEVATHRRTALVEELQREAAASPRLSPQVDGRCHDALHARMQMLLELHFEPLQ